MTVRRQLGPVLLLSLMRLALGYAVASPLLVALAGAGVSAFPGGDARLFRPGGTFLVEMSRLSSGYIAIALEPMLWLALGAVALLLAGLSFVMVALAHERRPALGEWARESFDCLPSFVLLMGLTVLAQVLALLLVFVVAALVLALVPESSPRLRDLGWCGAAAVALAIVAALGTLQDLARAARVALGVDVRRALERGLAVLLTYPVRVLASYGVRALASAGAVVIAAVVVGALHVERDGGLRLLAVFVMHQAAASIWAVLRAGWLADALSLVRISPQPALAGIPAGSVAPADPMPDPAA